MPHHRFRQSDSKYVYGVLVGRINDGQENPRGKSPHYEILVDVAGTPYRLAVNIKSVEGSEVMAYFDRDYSNDTKLGLRERAAGGPGFTALRTGDGGEGLDYVRDDLFPLHQMGALPPDGNGVTLAALLDAQVERAKRDAQAVAIAVGDKIRR